MPREIPYPTDKSLIFRETFDSQANVERNGGTCTDIVFSESGAYFNGTSSKIDYGNTDKMKFNSTNKFSFRCIVKPIFFSGYNALVTKWNHNIQNQYILGFSNSELVCWIATILTTTTAYYTTNNASLNTTDFVEIVFVYNSMGSTNADKLKIYKNGQLLTGTFVNTIPSALTNANANFQMGYNVILNAFKGYMKLIEAYNKALTAEEVKNLYNKNSYKDIRNGLILDIDARGGSIIDRCGNSLTINNTYPRKMNNSICCYFDGTSSTTSGILPNLSLSLPITINLWCKIIYTSDYVALFGYSDFPISIRRLLIQQTSGPFLLSQFGGANLISSTFKPFKWNMVSMTIDSSGNEYLYINGTLSSSVGTSNSLHSSNQIGFGSTWGLAQYIQRHYQNQQRIYNRVLSAEEIAQLYTYQKRNYE